MTQSARDAMVPVAHEVVATHRETHDTVTITLTPPAGEAASFAPGQFNMLAPFGVGECAISIAGDPSDPLSLVHTIRNVGSTTAALTSLAPGDHVGLRGPFGVGWPVERVRGRDVVVVAGGIGLAPVRPVILDLLADRDRFGEISIVYGARTPGDLLFKEDLHTWRSRFDLHCEVTVDRAAPGWFGDVGFVTALMDLALSRVEDPVVMVCGPEPMMVAVADRVAAAGTTVEDIYLSFERNMRCGIGLCGHCQYGADFLCATGPVLAYSEVTGRLRTREI
jgi:NAD(P)H-flavin reductase